MTVPLAHETWFEKGAYPTDWSFAGETATLALLAGALLVTLAVRALGRLWPGVDVPFLGRMAPWMPFAVRLHLAVSLIGLLSLGVYLSPWHTRGAAWLLIALGPLGMIEYGHRASARAWR